MWLWPVWDFIKANRWLQILLIAIAAIATLGIYLAMRDNGVRQRERARQAVETARERARVVATGTKIAEDIGDAKDAALAAPDLLPEFTSADELRDRAKPVSRVILRNSGAGQR